jgi:hypothetical protein
MGRNACHVIRAAQGAWKLEMLGVMIVKMGMKNIKACALNNLVETVSSPCRKNVMTP